MPATHQPLRGQVYALLFRHSVLAYTIMSRPLRIEYPGAWYHVMNRGAGRQSICHNMEHRQLFLELLGEVSDRFSIEIHAFCLMDNHYHLMIHTPLGNLSPAMRHLNGVYTQRFNRLTARDGSLFRGRYKAILVEADSYALQLSRYIHLNPVEAGLVTEPARHSWSSYPAYIGSSHPVRPWLCTSFLLNMFNGERESYRSFVEAGVDKELAQFYRAVRQSPVLGSAEFTKKVSAGINRGDKELADTRRLEDPVSLDVILRVVAEASRIPVSKITGKRRPRSPVVQIRNMAMYLGQRYSQASLSLLAETFGLNHYTSVSSAIGKFRRQLSTDATMGDMVRVVEDRIEAKR